jgi:vacuolar-type H+-ATPase subunit H
MDAAQYCRDIEAYLCRKNEGHLIRIAGPVFEQVSGWAAQGVPLAVAFRGIDRYCERYYAKGPRRRPVRVEFCEADVLELFDDWRRAVGVAGLISPPGDVEPPVKRDSLPAHLDRAIARLTAMRAGRLSPAFDRRIEEAVREMDRTRAAAKQAHGEARSALIDRLSALDRDLLDAAREDIDRPRRAALLAEAETEIAPFAARMTAEARVRAIDAAFDRLLRDLVGLPVLSHES